MKQPQVLIPSFDFAMEGYTPAYPEAQLLTVRQANVLSRVYFHSDPMQRQQLMAQLTDKLCSSLSIEPQTPDHELFIRRVLDDYYYYCSTIEA